MCAMGYGSYLVYDAPGALIVSTVPAGFCDYPPSEGLRSLNPARPLFLKEIWLKKVTFSTSNYKPLDIATSKRVDGRYFTT